jgi:histidine triad (HIT) family protein
LRIVPKPEALALLERHTLDLLNGGEGCVMCALAGRRDHELIIHEDARGVVRLDRFGSRRGHLLVVAKRHVESATALDWPEFCEIQRLAYDACRVIENTLRPKRVYVAALGASNALSMSYPHYHLHLVPVYEDDESARPAQVFSWSAGVVVYEPAEASELVAELGDAWPKSHERAPSLPRTSPNN